MVSLCALSQTCRFYRDNISEALYQEKLQLVCPWFEPRYSRRSSWRECAVEYSRHIKLLDRRGERAAEDSQPTCRRPITKEHPSLDSNYLLAYHFRRLTLNDEFLPIDEIHVGDSWLRDLNDYLYRYTSKHGIEIGVQHLARRMPLAKIRVLSFPNVLVIIAFPCCTKATPVANPRVDVKWKASQRHNSWAEKDTTHVDYFVVGPHLFLYFVGETPVELLTDGKLSTEKCVRVIWYLNPKTENCRQWDIIPLVVVPFSDSQSGKLVGYDGKFFQPWGDYMFSFQLLLEN